MSSILRFSLHTGARAARFTLSSTASRRALNFIPLRQYSKRPTEVPPTGASSKKKAEDHQQKNQIDKKAQQDKKQEDKKHLDKKQQEEKKHSEGKEIEKAKSAEEKPKQSKHVINETLAKFMVEEYDSLKSVVDAEPIVPHESHLYNFLKDNDLKLVHDVENEVYKLTKESDGRLIMIEFDDKLPVIDEIYNENPEDEEARADEDGDEDADEDADEDEDVDDDDDDDVEERERNELNAEEAANNGNEHEFRVDIRNASDPEGGVRIIGSAVHNGGLVFTELQRHPVDKYTALDVSYWREDVQQAFSEWMSEHACVNDKFAYFMHELLGKRQFEDWVKVLDEFRKIVKNN